MTQTSYAFPDSPYFDDYDPLKLYYKLLFKPKNLIQARELNQLQTILQEQIYRFGSHIFKNGSIVLGCESKINPTCYTLSVVLDTALSDLQLESLEGRYISSNLKIGQILKVQKTSIANTLELVINDFTESTIAISDVCYLYDFENKIQSLSGIQFRVIDRVSSCLVKFNSGILYFDGYFIQVDEQKIVLSSTESTFSGSIGFQINKVVKAFNGQDILTVNPVLVSKPIIFMDSGEDLSGQTIVDDFIEFIRVKQGKILKNISVPIYSELEKVLARRTFDQAGNFTSTPFTCKVTESADTTKFKLEISPGKAYVLGYEFDSPFSQSIEIDKALDYNQKTDYQLSTYYGSYGIVTNFSGFFDTQTCEKVLLLDQLRSALNFEPGGNYEDHIIGTARVRNAEFQGDQLVLYLFDIQASTDKSIIDSIKSIACADLSKENVGYGDLVDSKIYDFGESTLLFELPEKEIRTIRDTSNKVNTDYYIQKTFYSPLTISEEPGSPATPVFGILSTDPGEQFITSPTDITLVDRTSGAYYHPDTVESLNPEATQIRFGIDLELSEVDVYAKVRVVNQSEIPLTVESKTVSLSIQSFNPNQEYTLPESDIISITACSFNGTDILNYVTVGSKETIDAVYNSVLTYTGSLFTGISGTLSVTYSFYKMKRVNGYLSIDSYPATATVRTFKNSSKTISIGKCIDFRARIIDGEVSNAYIPIPSETFQCSYSYYLPRIDKLIATSSKTFEIVRGMPRVSPAPPDDKPYGMTLYTINIPAKTENLKDVVLNFVENRRYTMRDIGDLDKRIRNLEYYSALSLLEKDTKDMEILDENGNNRFKNGFIIDNFKNFKSVNYPEGSVKCSFNTELGELRPTFTIKNHKLLYNPLNSTCRQTGDLLTLPYSEVSFIEQMKASSAMNLQPFEVFNYEGKLTLTPEVDEWVDTTTKPAIIANQFSENDIWEEIGASAFTAQWGSWESKISQTPPTQNVSSVDPSKFEDLTVEPVKKLWNPSSDPHVPTNLISSYNDWVNSGFTAGFPQTSPDGTINGQPALYLDFKGETTNSTRTGSQSAFGESNIITSSMGESVSDISILPFIRANNIQLIAKYLKPDTRFYLYFDDTEITNYFQQYSSPSYTPTPSNTPTKTPRPSSTPTATPTPSTTPTLTPSTSPPPYPIPSDSINLNYQIEEVGDSGLYQEDGRPRMLGRVDIVLSIPDSKLEFNYGTLCQVVIELIDSPVSTKHYHIGRYNLHFLDATGNEILFDLPDRYLDIIVGDNSVNDFSGYINDHTITGKKGDKLYFPIILKKLPNLINKPSSIKFNITFDANLMEIKNVLLVAVAQYTSGSTSGSTSVLTLDSNSKSTFIVPQNNPYIAPIQNINSESTHDEMSTGVITSDSNGAIAGIVYLPGGTFTLGSHDIVIRDSKLNDSVNLSSYANTKYTAAGLSQSKQETIISTREPVIISNPVTENKSDYKIAWNYEDVEILPTPTPTPTPSLIPVSGTPPPSITPTLYITPYPEIIFSVSKIIEDEFNVVFRIQVSTNISFSVSIYSQTNWKYHQYTPYGYGTISQFFDPKTTNETTPFDYVIDHTLYPNSIKQQNEIVHYITVQHAKYDNKTYPGPIVFTNLNNQKSYSFNVPLAVLPADFIIFNWIDNETIRCAISDDAQPPYLEIGGSPTEADTNILKYINDGDIVKPNWESLTYHPIKYMNNTIMASNEQNNMSFEPFGIFKFSNPSERIVSDTGFKHKWFTLKVIPGRHVQRRMISTGRKSFNIRFKIRYKNTQNWISSNEATVLFDYSVPGELRLYNNLFKDTNKNPKFYNIVKFWDGKAGTDKLSSSYYDKTLPYQKIPVVLWCSGLEQTFYNFYTKEFVDEQTAYNDQSKYLYWIYAWHTLGFIPQNVYSGDYLSYGQVPTKLSNQSLPQTGGRHLQVNQDIADFFSKAENSSFRLPIQYENYYGVLSNILTFNLSDIGITTGQKICFVDPLAESFFVDEAEYPEGVFISSLDVYFKEKSPSSPVDVQIRPNVNGYPSSTEYLPFSDVILSPDKILVSEDASVPTRFTFKAPVYLKPGDYSFMVRAKDTKVKAWVARLGEYILGSTDTRITSNAYIGTLFKSANSSTWVAEGETDLKFRINRCSFSTSSSMNLECSPFLGEGNILQDRSFSTLNTQIATIIPSKTSIDNTKVSVLNIDNLVVTKPININETVEFDELWHLQDVRDKTAKTLNLTLPTGEYMRSSLVNPTIYYDPSLTLSLTLSSTKETVSPVIDLQKLSITTINNIINYPSDLSGELDSGVGPAQFCYITKPVKLSSVLMANKLLVNFAGQLHSTDDNKVLVYYRIYNSLEDPNHKINQKGWTLLGTKISNGTYSWVDYNVETGLIYYDGDETITEFDYFQIKLVGLSSNSAKFPKIKDFRTIALTA